MTIEQDDAVPVGEGTAYQAVDLSDNESLYSYTQRARLELAGYLRPTSEENCKNQDPKILALYLKSLGDMDKQALSRERMDTDKEVAANEQATAQLITDAMARMPKNPLMLEDSKVPANFVVPSPELPEFDLIEGELESGMKSTNIREFRDKHSISE